MFKNVSALSPEFDVPYEAVVIDRPEELNALSHAILQKGTIVWICGRAGTGKTTLLRLLIKRYVDWFRGHRTEIEYVNCRDYEKVDQKVRKACEKPEWENTLLLFDDTEHLSQKQLDEIFQHKKNRDNLKFIFSSRERPNISDPEIKHNLRVLDIKPPDIFKVLQNRFKLLKDENTIARARQIFDEYLQSVKQTNKTPREILREINELFYQHADVEASVSKEAIQIEEDASGNVIGIRADFIGIIFALVLFLVAQFSAKQTEKNLVEKIKGIKTTIEYVVSLYASENENIYFVNRPVNFRDKPSTKRSKVLKVLQPNNLVTLVKRDGKWMYVKYSDYVNETENYGWVYEKYLSKFVLKEK